MAYRTILVSLNELNRLPQLLSAVATIARNFNAHVSGLYVIPAVQLYPSMGFEAVPPRPRSHSASLKQKLVQ